MKFFATTTKGLEEVLADELNKLGVREVVTANGGVNFSGSLKDGYRACLWLRTANRVLRPIASFPCPSQEALYEGVYALNWNELLTPSMTLAVNAKLRDSEITHSHFAALKTKDAIVDKIRTTARATKRGPERPRPARQSASGQESLHHQPRPGRSRPAPARLSPRPDHRLRKRWPPGSWP